MPLTQKQKTNVWHLGVSCFCGTYISTFSIGSDRLGLMVSNGKGSQTKDDDDDGHKVMTIPQVRENP
jgi:hypothetical protein